MLKKLKLNSSMKKRAKKDVLFITGDWKAKGGSQEIPRVTGKFGRGVQYEAGQRLTEFAFDLLRFVLQGQTCLLLQVSLDFLLCIPVSYNEKDIFFGC